MGRADTVDLSARVDALTARVAALEAALSAAVAREAERLRLARESAGVAGDRAAPPRGGAGSARGGAEGGEGSGEGREGAAGAPAAPVWPPPGEAWWATVDLGEGVEEWRFDVWRDRDGWATEDLLAATRCSRGATPEEAIRRVFALRAAVVSDVRREGGASAEAAEGVRWVGDAVRGGEALAPVAAVTWSAIGPVVVAAEARVDAEGALVVVDAAWRPDDGDEHGAAVAAAALARWCSQRGAVLRGMRREGGE